MLVLLRGSKNMMITVFYWQTLKLLLVKYVAFYISISIYIWKGIFYSGTNYDLDFKSEAPDIIKIEWVFNGAAPHITDEETKA